MAQNANRREGLGHLHDALGEIRALARVLGSRGRLSSLAALAMGPMDVTRVAEVSGRSLASASRSLGQLCRAGLVRSVRVKNRRVYMLSAAARLDVRGIEMSCADGEMGGGSGLGGGVVRVAEITLDRRGVGKAAGGGGGGAERVGVREAGPARPGWGRGRLTIGLPLPRGMERDEGVRGMAAVSVRAPVQVPVPRIMGIGTDGERKESDTPTATRPRRRG